MALRLAAIFLMFLLLPNSVFAEVKTITLKHRVAAELLEPVRELLDADEKAQAAGATLILVADGESLNAAEQLILQLDRQLMPLLVRLKLSEQQQPVGQDVSTAIVIGNHSQLSVSSSGSRQLGNSRLDSVQSLSIVEGSRGWFEVGKEIPYRQQWSAFAGDISGYSEQIAYKTVTAGFWVYPIQVIENSVLVDIEPQINQLADRNGQGPPGIKFSELRSRLKIPLGKWYPIGGHLQQHDQVSRDIIAWGTRNTAAGQVFYLRIDPAAGFSP